MIDSDADIHLISDGGKERSGDGTPSTGLNPPIHPASNLLGVDGQGKVPASSISTEQLVAPVSDGADNPLVLQSQLRSQNVEAKHSADLKIADIKTVDPKIADTQPPEVADIRGRVIEHWDAVYRLMYRLSGNRHEAEDLTQESFLRAIERQSSFKSGTYLRAWIFRIATNAFLDRKRRLKLMKSSPLPDDMNVGNVMVTMQGPEAAMENAERHVKVEQAISELPEVERVIFVLRSQCDLSFREISEIVAMSEETARWHMMLARRQLMSKLEDVLA